MDDAQAGARIGNLQRARDDLAVHLAAAQNEVAESLEPVPPAD